MSTIPLAVPGLCKRATLTAPPERSTRSINPVRLSPVRGHRARGAGNRIHAAPANSAAVSRRGGRLFLTRAGLSAPALGVTLGFTLW